MHNNEKKYISINIMCECFIAWAGINSQFGISINIGRFGGIRYGSGISWLANANAAAGTSLDDGLSPTDGLMTWGSQCLGGQP